ncbi:MAG TPA: hypothetical protein VGA69_04540 [Nitriliruptorales bacterium]
MRFNRRSIAAVAAVGALALAVPALAVQDDDDVPSTEQEAGAQPTHETRKQRLAEALAQELGLTTEEVEAALEAVHDRFRAEHEAARLERVQERLAAAVEEGDLTQEQADAILEAAENGVFPGGLGHRGPRGHHALKGR